MSLSSPDATFKKILANARNPQRLRLAALQAMSRPQIYFLLRLERDPETPVKLKFAAAQRRLAEMLIRKATDATLEPAKPEDDPATDC
jgi:uncharacterized protein YpiB (UPF0302 family)